MKAFEEKVIRLQAARFQVVPRYEGDFVTIIFPPKLAQYIPILRETDPEAYARLTEAINALEITLLDAGYVGQKLALYDAEM